MITFDCLNRYPLLIWIKYCLHDCCIRGYQTIKINRIIIKITKTNNHFQRKPHSVNYGLLYINSKWPTLVARFSVSSSLTIASWRLSWTASPSAWAVFILVWRSAISSSFFTNSPAFSLSWFSKLMALRRERDLAFTVQTYLSIAFSFSIFIANIFFLIESMFVCGERESQDGREMNGMHTCRMNLLTKTDCFTWQHTKDVVGLNRLLLHPCSLFLHPLLMGKWTDSQ